MLFRLMVCFRGGGGFVRCLELTPLIDGFIIYPIVSCVLTSNHRRIPQVRRGGPQRQLLPRVAPGGRVQHVVYRQAVQRAHGRELQLAGAGRLYGLGM